MRYHNNNNNFCLLYCCLSQDNLLKYTVVYCLIMAKSFITGHVIQEEKNDLDSEKHLTHMNVSIINNIIIVYKDQPTFFRSHTRACSL